MTDFLYAPPVASIYLNLSCQHVHRGVNIDYQDAYKLITHYLLVAIPGQIYKRELGTTLASFTVSPRGLVNKMISCDSYEIKIHSDSVTVS